MSRFYLSRMREAATRDDEEDQRQVTVKRTRIARQLISPWTARAPVKERGAGRGGRYRGKLAYMEREDWGYA